MRLSVRVLFPLAVLLLLVGIAACGGGDTPTPDVREVTQEVEVTREVPITQEVEVTTEVQGVVTSTPEPTDDVSAESVDPSEDRVGYPEGYQDDFTIWYEFDRPDNGTARVIYANNAAASVTQQEWQAVPAAPDRPFSYGSILVMEVYATQRNEDGTVALGENGRYVRDELFGTFIMRKEQGFGAKYGTQRNGEWEYMAYRPDGSQLLPPQATQNCAACHVEAGQGRDWVFGAHRAFGIEPAEVGENAVNVIDYTFAPSTITVTVGTEVTWVNNDVIFHTVTADDGSFNSGMLRPNASFSHTFEEVGTFPYFCAVHPSMRGTIVVTE